MFPNLKYYPTTTVFFCVQENKEMYTGMEEVEWNIIFIFGLTFPLNLSSFLLYGLTCPSIYLSIFIYLHISLPITICMYVFLMYLSLF